jgi:hypothetical protein
LRHLPEYEPLVDKVVKGQISNEPVEIQTIVFKQEYINDKFVQNLEITKKIHNKPQDPILIEPQDPILIEPQDPILIEPLTLMQQLIEFLINFNYLGFFKYLILIFILYKILRKFY